MAEGVGRHSRHAADRRRRSRLWPFLLSLVLVVAAVAGGLALHRSSQNQDAAANAGTSTPTIDLAARSAAVDQVLKRRSQAVLTGNEQEFVADVDPANTKLVARQRVLFTNLRQFGFAKLAYQQLAQQYDDTIAQKYGPSTYLVAVAMEYQLRGIDLVPVRAMLGYTFSRRANGTWMLVSDSDLDQRLPRGSHQEAWDFGPVLVKRAPRVLVVVDQGQDALATKFVTMSQNAVQAVSTNWPGGWNGSGLVIALDQKVVRGADYTQPKNAEDALAMATWVYRTLPGEVTGEGERADSYVVVNPNNRDKVDTRTLAHEFTHVATAPYGPYAPRWLVEGSATYVEFLHMPGQNDLAIPQYRQDVRTKYLAKATGLPPDATFFDHADSSYPLSWLALDYLFTRFGGTEVGTLYRELASLGSTQKDRDRIMLEHIGMTEAGLFRALKAAAAA
ncbi:hypothetical protein GCM10009630_24740 [Kribbella jejuensis]|uniref:Basic secretory peptidase family protein n=1 Tax=Kribbella jejuensis TaxID=236068 RepID=A0A542D993_9ACTN|nr:hypothetical protein [Kribbella jejuensis]TQI99652.1 hypothetical protein FB475_6639 [Kribbella jejuensis]